MNTRYRRLSAKQLFFGLVGGLVGFALGFGLPFTVGFWLTRGGFLDQEGSERATEAVAWLVLICTPAAALVGAKCGFSLSGYKS
ncbi:MAG: hypothetical protein AAF596_08915 [Planctomycetota bacterium]